MTGNAQQLPPGASIGMAIGAEIPPTHPAPIRTGRIRAELVRGVDLTAASARHDEARKPRQNWRGLRRGGGAAGACGRGHSRVPRRRSAVLW